MRPWESQPGAQSRGVGTMLLGLPEVHEKHQKKHSQSKAVLREAPEEAGTGQEVGVHPWAQTEKHKPGQ